MIHNSADVSPKAKIHKNVKIWPYSTVREGATIGADCIIGRNIYIDHHVRIGSKVKIQNNTLIYYGVTIEDKVFIGPGVCFTNDKHPRATLNGRLKKSNDWQVSKTLVKEGASIGAGAVILPGIKIGAYAMIGAGSVVTKSVPDCVQVVGNPAKFKGYVCRNGHPLNKIISTTKTYINYYCDLCQKKYQIKNEEKSY